MQCEEWFRECIMISPLIEKCGRSLSVWSRGHNTIWTYDFVIMSSRVHNYTLSSFLKHIHLCCPVASCYPLVPAISGLPTVHILLSPLACDFWYTKIWVLLQIVIVTAQFSYWHSEWTVCKPKASAAQSACNNCKHLIYELFWLEDRGSSVLWTATASKNKVAEHNFCHTYCIRY